MDLDDRGPADLPWSPACERNREPIRAVLERWLSASTGTRDARILEIGGGTGQHAEYFSTALPWLHWQTTDRREYLSGLRARTHHCNRDNLPPPLELDVTWPEWPELVFDHVFTANTCHIMHWPAVEAMFNGIARRLPHGGLVFVYGPFHRNGEPTSPSNRDFDASLRTRDPGMGIRDDAVMAGLAEPLDLAWVGDEALPANNRMLVWQRV